MNGLSLICTWSINYLWDTRRVDLYRQSIIGLFVHIVVVDDDEPVSRKVDDAIAEQRQRRSGRTLVRAPAHADCDGACRQQC